MKLLTPPDGMDGIAQIHMCNLNEPVFHFINMHWMQWRKPSTLSQDAVRANQNLIRDNFKDQFRMSMKTSVNYLV